MSRKLPAYSETKPKRHPIYLNDIHAQLFNKRLDQFIMNDLCRFRQGSCRTAFKIEPCTDSKCYYNTSICYGHFKCETSTPFKLKSKIRFNHVFQINHS